MEKRSCAVEVDVEEEESSSIAEMLGEKLETSLIDTDVTGTGHQSKAKQDRVQ
jgi:hypothetical protein